jgi:hypothetical protein
MALASKLAKGAMERTKKFLGLPGYDEGTAAAQKEVDDEIARLKKIEKSKELTDSEEKKLDRLMNRKMREEGAETSGGMARERKGKGLSEKEKKQMQESLEFKKGGLSTAKDMAKKKKPMTMAKGGMSTGYAKGGMSTGYNKGGMANCGASMKPNGPKKGK